MAKSNHEGYDGCGGNETMSDVVHHDPKTFNGSHAEQSHIPRFGENDFVYRFETFGAENGITRFPRDKFLSGGGETAFPHGLHLDAGEYISWQPSQFRASVYQHLDRQTGEALIFDIAGHNAHFEHAHSMTMITRAIRGIFGWPFHA